MIKIDTALELGVGSNSKVFGCVLGESKYAAKVPHNPERYISCALQVDALRHFWTHCPPNSHFLVPKVISYEEKNDTWGELLVMERFDNIYPVNFLLRTGMVDSEHIVTAAAEAVAELHNIKISGFDIEFYWSYEHQKLVVLDVGPRFTVGYTGQEMVQKHCAIVKGNRNRMASWNIVSELLEAENAVQQFDRIMRGEYFPDIGMLENSLIESAAQQHIQGVAQNHYLQLIGDCPNISRKRLVNLFLRRFAKVAQEPNYLYMQSFSEAFKQNIKSTTAYLYISKHKTVSKMSNTVSIP